MLCNPKKCLSRFMRFIPPLTEAQQAISKAAGHAASACGLDRKTKASVKLPVSARVKQESTEAIKLSQETEHV